MEEDGIENDNDNDEEGKGQEVIYKIIRYENVNLQITFRIDHRKNENDQYQRRVHSMVYLDIQLLAMIQLHHHQ